MPVSRRAFLSVGKDPSQHGLDIRVVRITPEIAATWLSANTKNRSKKPGFIKKLIKQILLDQYKLNGETIIFSSDGYLLDGQNRLYAIVQAGRAVESLAVYGVGSDFQITMDTGNQRSGADALVMEGEGNSTALSTAIKVLYGWVTDVLNNERTPSVRPAQVIEILSIVPELRESVQATRCTRKLMSQGVAAGFHVIMAQVDKELADQFMSELGTGLNLKKSNAVYTLRETINKANQKSGKRGVRKTDIRGWLIKAWNAYVEGRRVSLGPIDVHDFPIINDVPAEFVERCQAFNDELVVA